jgi:hypothetical protein
LGEVGVKAVWFFTLNRRLPVYATQKWRHKLAAACAQHAALGSAFLVMFDVSTLYFDSPANGTLVRPSCQRIPFYRLIEADLSDLRRLAISR